MQQGESYEVDTAAIIAKKRRGDPLSFAEVLALKYGMQAAASPHPAPAAVTVSAREDVLRLARAVQEKNPRVSKEAAFIAALDANDALAARYRAEQPDAPLAEKQHTPGMSAKRARVEELSAALVTETGVTIEQARSRVWMAHPELRE